MTEALGLVAAVRAERDTTDPAVVREQSDGFLLCVSFKRRGVPEEYGAVLARRHESVPVAAEGHAAESTDVSAQGETSNHGKASQDPTAKCPSSMFRRSPPAMVS